MLLTVAAYTEPWEAHIVVGRLQAEGIPATLAHDQHVTLEWPLAIALGGVKVQVPPAFAEEAMAVERGYRDGRYVQELKSVYPDVSDFGCNRCGSMRLRSYPSWSLTLLAILSLGIAAIIFPPLSTHRSCLDCGHQHPPHSE